MPHPQSLPRYVTLIELLVLAALWGGSFIFLRIAAPEFGPVALIAVRVTVAALVLMPCLFFNNNFQKLVHYRNALFLIGLLSAAIPFVLFAFSAHLIGAGVLSVLNATTPLWTAIVAWTIYQQQLPLMRALGLLIGFLGVVILVYGQLQTQDHPWFIYLLPMLATLCYGFAGNLTQRYLQTVPALVTSFGSLLASSIVLSPIALFTWPTHPISTTAWIATLLLAFFSTALAYWIFFRLIQRIGSAQTMSVLYLSPVFAIIWAYLFLHENISITMLIGMGIIFAGVSLALGLIKKKPSLFK